MHTGHYISGAGHLGLIGWLLFGGVLRPEPIPFQTQEVSVISGAEFEAIIAAQQAPEQTTEVAQPAAPEVTPDAPAVEAAPDTDITQPEPLQAEQAPADAPPEVTEQSPPPQAEVSDEAPLSPEPPSEVTVLVPEVAPEAVPRPVERVAPEPIAQPEPEATPDTEQQQAVEQDAPGEVVEQEPQEATAPEEATTEIVTEAAKAPARSPRPPSNRPAARAPVQEAAAKPRETVAEEPEAKPTPTPTPEPKPATDTAQTDADAIAAAVAAAQSSATETPTPAAPSGPPLSAGEKESLRVAVSACWNVGSLSSEALRTTVVVTVSMNPDGTPNTGSIQLAGSSGGSDGAARQAFEAARRAIIRCGAKGYQLPSDKYGQWQNIEMTFNPERMRIK